MRRRGRPPRWERRNASPRRARSLCSASARLVGPRSASARRRRRGPTRCAARASPLASRARGPVPDPPIPLLDHRGGGCLRSAPRGTPRRFAPRACGPGSDPPIPPLDHRGGGRPRSAPRDAAAPRRRRGSTGARRAPRRPASRAHGPGSDPPILDFSSTTVAAIVFAPLHEGRLAAPPLGPVVPARIPRSLSSTTVAAVVSAPRARGAAAGSLPGARLVPRRSPLGPVGLARILRSFSSTTVAAIVSAPLHEGRLAAPPLGPVVRLGSPVPSPRPPWWRSSLLRERAVPPPGSYPVRGSCLAARLSGPWAWLRSSDPSPRPPWLRSSVLRSAMDALPSPYPDCRRCLFAGLSRSRCSRAGLAGPLRRPRRPCRSSTAAALLHCGWASTSIAGPKMGSVSVQPRTPTVVTASV